MESIRQDNFNFIVKTSIFMTCILQLMGSSGTLFAIHTSLQVGHYTTQTNANVPFNSQCNSKTIMGFEIQPIGGDHINTQHLVSPRGISIVQLYTLVAHNSKVATPQTNKLRYLAFMWQVYELDFFFKSQVEEKNTPSILQVHPLPPPY